LNGRTWLFLFFSIGLIVSLSSQSPVDMPEKFPVKQQVDNEQYGECKTRNVMVQDPVMPGYAHADPARLLPLPDGR